MEKLPLRAVRTMVMEAQLLDEGIRFPRGREGAARIIEKLGYVQIDPLSVVKRSHHHTLWTRLPGYEERMLQELQSRDRRIFEYWAHALSYLPMADYRFYLPRMRNAGRVRNHWVRFQEARGGKLKKPVLERIRVEGPLGVKELISLPGTKKSRSGRGEGIRAALDLLFWSGELMISERHDFRKIYDLSARVLPPGIDQSLPAEGELGGFFIERALSAMGVARRGEIYSF
ncbi:MAG: winged helix DNA-binding domain-containing protein, partial [Candidatus Krumholzibacteriota bacterium]|nr:winged helix DNA-binding domain-containing protein [Candidatus Krumholzibacteriota bacterium]